MTLLTGKDALSEKEINLITGIAENRGHTPIDVLEKAMTHGLGMNFSQRIN